MIEQTALHIDALTGLLVAAICFLAAAVGGLSGFGSGLIMSVAMAPLVGVKAVVPLISVAMIFTNAARIWVYRASFNPRIAVILLATSIPASVLGAIVYVNLDARLVSIVFGFVLVLSMPVNHFLRRRRLSLTPWTLAPLGLIFGFLSSNIIGAGMIIPPILIGSGLLGPAVIASDAAIAVGTSVFKVMTFGAMDALTPPLALYGVVMGLCTIPGTWASAWLMARTSLRLHTALIEACIAVAGINFIWQGFNAA
ncbi:MAG TPA: sulfite exporter TauE/SafE family protein [Mesorhizobium sp.]|jgi:hypothetical protein